MEIKASIDYFCLSLEIALFTTVILSEKNIENTNLLLDKMQNELYNTQFEEYEKQHIEITKIRHDMKNHLQCIATLISEEEYSNANKYIEEIIKNKLNFSYKQINTGNRAVDFG